MSPGLAFAAFALAGVATLPVPAPPAGTIAAGTLAVAASPTDSAGAAGFATAEKPAGFRYSMVTEVWVDSLAATYLYVRRDKKSTMTTAVPVPADRALLALCVTGGSIDDLVPGTIVCSHDQDDSSLSDALARLASPITLLIGPEAGFSDEELDAARQAGVPIVRFGQTVLRTETAAVVFAALVIDRLSSR